MKKRSIFRNSDVDISGEKDMDLERSIKVPGVVFEMEDDKINMMLEKHFRVNLDGNGVIIQLILLDD